MDRSERTAEIVLGLTELVDGLARAQLTAHVKRVDGAPKSWLTSLAFGSFCTERLHNCLICQHDSRDVRRLCMQTIHNRREDCNSEGRFMCNYVV